MNKKKTTAVSVVLCLVLLVFVGILVAGQQKGGHSIVLPKPTTDSESGDNSSDTLELNVVTIAPGTVQPAINTLSRPITYQRTQTVETFWSGGSGRSVSRVSVRGGLTRVDTTLADGGVSHLLVNGSSAAIWYDEEETWSVLTTQQFSADVAQRMLSYEDILDLDVSQILRAEYREENGIYCIFVCTAPDSDGYWDQYWVSVSSGLLLKAERYINEELIYRFSASEPESDTPAEEMFLLPDGSVLSLSGN